MGIFSKFEGKMEDTFEGAASTMFKAPISPVQIAKKAEKQMRRESTKMVGVGKQYAPTLYTVLVNAEDDSNLFGYYPTLAGETETFLAAKASELGLYMDGQPLVRFIVDEGLRHGKFDVIAETVAAPIIAQLRDEEMQRYGIGNVQGRPQGNVSGYGQQFSRSQAVGAPVAGGAGAPGMQASAPAQNFAQPHAGAYQAAQPAQPAQAAQMPAASAPAVPAANASMAASNAAGAPGYAAAGAVAGAAAGLAGAASAVETPEDNAANPYTAGVNPVVTPPSVQSELPATPSTDDYDLQYQDEQFDADYDADFGDSYDTDFGSDFNNFDVNSPIANDPFAQDQFAANFDDNFNDGYAVNDAPDFSGFAAEGDFADGAAVEGSTPAAYAAPAAYEAAPAAQAAPVAPNYDNTVVFAGNQQAAPNYQHAHGQLTDIATRRTYDLAGNRLLIGRESKSDIVVADINVSRQHAELRWDPQGYWVLNDLGSTNGTYVNGSAISSQPLQDGDRITFGVTDFLFSQQ